MAKKKTIAEMKREMSRIKKSKSSYRKNGKTKAGKPRMKAAPKRKLQSLGGKIAARKRR